MFQDEKFYVKMRSLQADSSSHMLSLALSLSTIVVLLGICGLIIVANHRQRRKRQLKKIIRAKNMKPLGKTKTITGLVKSTLPLCC